MNMISRRAAAAKEAVEHYPTVESATLPKPIATMTRFLQDRFGGTYFVRGLSLIPFPAWLCCVTHDVTGELLYGVARSQNPSRNAKLLKNLVDALPVIHANDAIMQAFATQKAALAARGELVDDADLLIAATALVYGATLTTCNVRHFARFTDLRMEDWG